MDPSRLEAAAIVATAENLSLRIDERFDGRGISEIGHHLQATARATCDRLAELHRPRRALRYGIAALILLGLAVAVLAALSVDLTASEVRGFDDWIMVLEAGFQDVVFVGLAVVFVRGIETRLVRKDALVGLHELRSVAHVIDMHQLTKDPEALLRPDQRTEHSPPRNLNRFELTRYLDYCSEMLSITAKLAAMYAQESQDAVVLGAVREIESLSSDMSSEVWQKALLLQIQQSSEGAQRGSAPSGSSGRRQPAALVGRLPPT